jgi:hypothetical protein
VSNTTRNRILLAASLLASVLASLFLGVASVVLLVTATGRFFPMFDCGNTRVSEIVSPDGAMKLVVFERNCGATTDFTTQASLINAGEPLDDESGNVFIADADHGSAPRAAHGGPQLDVRWLDATTVQLTVDPRARVFHAPNQFDDVKVVHRKSRR